MSKKDTVSETSVQPIKRNHNNAVDAVATKNTEKVNKTKITLSITQEDSDAVKIYALKKHTTVSDLLHEWIVEKCGD